MALTTRGSNSCVSRWWSISGMSSGSPRWYECDEMAGVVVVIDVSAVVAGVRGAAVAMVGDQTCVRRIAKNELYRSLLYVERTIL